MHKTTIYLDERMLRELKMLTAKTPKANMVSLIRQALREFLAKSGEQNRHAYLKRMLKQKPRKTSFGDPVSYQRALRKEWK
ncbi:MAG: hypothetical protein HY466_04330 [Deltaproteobacteria bacterium]|nr:hypothetical protein [Deltaproteobacteria bacterium]